MELTLPAINTDASFFQSLDRYVRQVAYDCGLPDILRERELINQVDLSTLSFTDQQGFNDWLGQRFYLRICVDNALRRGLLVEARLTKEMPTDETAFSLRVTRLRL